MRLLRSAWIVGAALVIVGCAHDDTDATVKDGSGVALNPGGKPRTAEEQRTADQMTQTGQGMNADRAAAAAAMAAAQKKAGGQ